MLTSNFLKPKIPIILPNANTILAKFIVIMVKNNAFIDFMYFFISKKIAKFIIKIVGSKMINLESIVILEKRINRKVVKVKSGSKGWKPLGPVLNLVKFKKSIPKQDL